MSHRFPTLIATMFLMGMAADAAAQAISDRERGPAGKAAARIHGIVTDQGGRMLDGVRVLALGTTLMAAKTDLAGRFSLLLPPGTYVLKAMRAGYISSLRESIHVRRDAPVEQHITLVRFADAAQPGEGNDGIGDLADSAADDHSHSERAWRLRQLPRTVLRDVASVGIYQDVDRPSRAPSFFAASEIVGQVNLLTTSALSNAGEFDGMPQGAAYVRVGAPVGQLGDWSVRASMASGAVRAWTVRGDYTARDTRTHRVRFGFFHSAQRPQASESAPPSPGNAATISLGRLYASDRWTVSPRLQVDYGARFDRYDYLAGRGALSPRASARVRVLPATLVTTSASRGAAAPGADQLLPLSSSGVWLPPVRTFSSLSSRLPIRVERVRHYDLAVEQELGADRARSIGVRRFAQTTTNQLSLLFGLDRASEVGHYYVASSGHVDVDGWTLFVRGRIAGPLRGRVEYTNAVGQWRGHGDRQLRFRNPSALRSGRERMHDVVSAIDLSVEDTTHVSLAYRVNSSFSLRSRSDAAPAPGGRFLLEVRQALPYQPTPGSALSLVFAIRTLQHEDELAGSFYDELLTVAPPTRITGGLQVWF